MKMMKIKFITSFTIVMVLTLFETPMINNFAIAMNDEMSLTEFFKTTENIEAYYTYPSMVASANALGKSKLNAHTPIIIRCVETVSTKDLVSGTSVNFAVVNDVRDTNGKILVKSGTPVSAQITFSKNNGMIGQSGELTVTDFSTTAVDGTYIPLSGSISSNPDDKMVASVVLSVLICPLFLLMKGEQAQLTAGTTKTAYTVSEVYIEADKL